METTGLQSGYHDIVQIAVLPLEPITLEPHPKYRPFYQNIRPINPDRADPIAMQVNGLDMNELLMCPTADQVEDALIDWFAGLELPLGKRIVTLCQNSPFDLGFMKAWLGIEGFESVFSRRGRDTMYVASGIIDREEFRGFKAPFNNVSLKGLCQHFGITIDNHHDAMADCIATAAVYRELLRLDT